MKLHPFLYTFPALLVVAPVATADISLGAPKAPVDRSSAYHAELLASNAVHAVFKEIRSIPVPSLDAAPTTEEVAVFEVKKNLAHRRYDRMGDGKLLPGKIFSVSLASDVPGQDAELGGFIRGLQAGDEALLNMDHIYVFREEGNESVRACTRFVKMQPKTVDPNTPAVAPNAPAADAAAPADSPARLPQQDMTTSRQVFSHITIEPDGQGGMRQMKIVEHRERTADGQEHIRRFINDVEVDPQTNKPLPLSAPVEPPAPAAAPVAAPDVIPDPATDMIENPDDDETPIPTPAPEPQD